MNHLKFLKALWKSSIDFGTLTAVLILFFSAVSSAAEAKADEQATKIQVQNLSHDSSAYGAPYFEPNVGQPGAFSDYAAHFERFSAFFGEQHAWFVPNNVHPEAKSPSPIRLSFIHASKGAVLLAEDSTGGELNYFSGARPEQWHTKIPTYSTLRYTGVYPGIDLLFRASGKNLEFDWLLAPGKAPGTIRMQLDGATKLTVTPQGGLLVNLPSSSFTILPPRVFQDENRMHEIPATFVVLGKNQFGFRVPIYDQHKRLTIDPVLQYSTYVDGPGPEFSEGYAIAVDSLGYVYLAGKVSGCKFPEVNQEQGPPPCTDYKHYHVFISKLKPDGSGLVYSTYLWGSYTDAATGIAVDSAGEAFVTGTTASGNFPLSHPFQSAPAGMLLPNCLQMDLSSCIPLISAVVGLISPLR
jgi:hypothetical protein